ncbi:hypothetical protein Bpfe_026711 [Biomphalaria pfeifferi]|uniref:Uncharacterized protein n=1 Tax=Biomphalaria pfeifferi TaxID=112525 RepID=A0AAD8AWN7_BIOPF|nr:hypothetical protein Bpfe_026711 [Biomphalaria pfeifferi]
MYKILDMSRSVYNLYWIYNAVIIVVTVSSCLCLEIQIQSRKAYVKNPDLASKFIDCMKADNSKFCYVYGQIKENNFYGHNVVKVPDENKYPKPIYSCSRMDSGQQSEYKYGVKCQRDMNIFCGYVYDCSFQFYFLIKWEKVNDYLDDAKLLENQCSQKCRSYSNRLMTPVPNVTTTLSSTSTIKPSITTLWQYMTTNRILSTEWQNTTSTNKSSLINWNSANTSDDEHPSNTTILIIAVIIPLCLIIAATVAIFYCVRKRYRSQNNAGTNIYANDSTAYVINFPSKSNSITSTYDMCKEDDEKSPPFQNKHNYNRNKGYLNISTNIDSDQKLENLKNSKMKSVDEGVYLNTNSDLKNKAYARLGDQVKVFKHDYNCLIPEDENNINIHDACRIPEEINSSADKTENTNNTLANDVLPIADTSAITYTLANDVLPLADTSANTYTLANDVLPIADTATNKNTLAKDAMPISDLSTNPYTLAKNVTT